MPSDLVSELERAGVQQTETNDLEKAVAESDVLYVTRVQKERFEDMAQYEQATSYYRVTPGLLAHAKKFMIVMHPLPR